MSCLLKVMKQRLLFIDVIRAYAICMMLQGHFITALLADPYWDESNIFFRIWHYFTGITAPVFLTISGFIFTYLLIREGDRSHRGWKNPRVVKGIRRGFYLILVACLLRKSIHYVEILHCIGLSLILMVGIYIISTNKFIKLKYILPPLLIALTITIFLFETTYNTLSLPFLPRIIANYFTPIYGTFFSILPWFGYVCLGGFMGSLFYFFKGAKYLYPTFITLLIVFGYIFHHQFTTFNFLYNLTSIELFNRVARSGFLFLRMGDALWVFAFFVILRNVITMPLIQRIGVNTLSIYVIHYIMLYSFIPKFNLSYYFHRSLTPTQAIIGAILFVSVVVFLSIIYNRVKDNIKEKIKGKE